MEHTGIYNLSVILCPSNFRIAWSLKHDHCHTLGPPLRIVDYKNVF